MLLLRKLRLISAIVLLCAIVLPLSECHRGHVDQPVTKSISQQLFPQDNADFLYFYAYEAFGSPLWGTITVLAFAWPLVFVFLGRKRAGSRLRLLFQALELLLCAGTIYWLNVLTEGGTWLYGVYVGIIAVAIFTFAGLGSWFVHVDKKSNQAMQPTAGRCDDHI